MPETKPKRELKNAFRNLYSDLTNPVTHWRKSSPHNEAENYSPFRSELLSPDQLEQHGLHLAESHQISRAPRSEHLLPRLNENEQVIETTYNYVTQMIHETERIPPAGEWLL